MSNSEDFITRIRDEYRYFREDRWTLKDVGDFWDTVVGYDDINSKIYPYFRRFTNSYKLAKYYLPRNDYQMLDIQTRSGNGSLFWHQQNKISHSTCVDFSDYLLKLADHRLKGSGLAYDLLKINNFPLPFKNNTFDLVCTYETIEHISNYEEFLSELVRVMTQDGILILTCPNKAWDWIHSVTAISGMNHSEGPHRFLSRKELLKCFKNFNLEVLEENSTIFLPFSYSYSIRLDHYLEKRLPEVIKRKLALRRTFILKKGQRDLYVT